MVNAYWIMFHRPMLFVSVLLVIISLVNGIAQPVFTGTEIFPADEFAARRAKTMAAIGDGVAVLQGTTERPGEQPFRQSNQFFYLTGVAEPRAILLIDGRKKTSTLFLKPRDDRREKMMFGPGLSPGPEAVRVTGIEAVLPRDEFGAALNSLAEHRVPLYTPFRPEVLGSASASDTVALARATKNDEWDGRSS